MDAIERTLILQKVPLFSTLVGKELLAISEELETVEMLSGEELFREGDSGSVMYIICTGQVEVTRGNVILTRLGQYDYFGELSLFDDKSRRASAKCLDDGLLIAIERPTFEGMIEAFPRILETFSETIISYLVKNRELSQQEGR